MGIEAFLALIVLGSIVYFFALNKHKNEEDRRKEEMQRAIALSDVDRMSGISFEHYVARLLANEGYVGVSVTKASGDFGVDVTASKAGVKYAIQVKRHTGSVSRRAVSDAVTGCIHYGCDRAMVVTNRYLSTQARVFALSVGCEIVDRDMLSEWIHRYQSQRVASGVAEATGDALVPTLSKTSKVQENSNEEHRVRSSSSGAQVDLSKSVGQNVPSSVLQRIKSMAAEAHPNDFSTQKYVVDEQVEAYKKLSLARNDGLPRPIFGELLERAAREHEFDYSTQLYVLSEQIDSYKKLLSFSPPGVPASVTKDLLLKAQEDHPYDFSTQLYVVKDQIDAYSSLNSQD